MKLLIAVSVLFTSLAAFAYGPSSIVVTERRYTCDLQNSADGVMIESKLDRKLWESRRHPGLRTLISRVLLSNGTDFDHGDGNIEQILAPYFYHAEYFEGNLNATIENTIGDKTLEMSTLIPNLTAEQDTAWAIDGAHKDMHITTKVGSGIRPFLSVTFTALKKSVTFEGTCYEAN